MAFKYGDKHACLQDDDAPIFLFPICTTALYIPLPIIPIPYMYYCSTFHCPLFIFPICTTALYSTAHYSYSLYVLLLYIPLPIIPIPYMYYCSIFHCPLFLFPIFRQEKVKYRTSLQYLCSVFPFPIFIHPLFWLG